MFLKSSLGLPDSQTWQESVVGVLAQDLELDSLDCILASPKPTLEFWVSCLIPLCLGFLICKVEMMNPFLAGCCED